jgi:hypothetical protein
MRLLRVYVFIRGDNLKLKKHVRNREICIQCIPMKCLYTKCSIIVQLGVLLNNIPLVVKNTSTGHKSLDKPAAKSRNVGQGQPVGIKTSQFAFHKFLLAK